ncbi:MAG TPA: hypothetical protein VJ022_14020, partial [Anaerolineales bacterium]|nr:hypothetical protein [Anaerolineales bacterium]
QAFTQILFSVEGGDPLYLNSLRAGPLYSMFGIALIGLTVMSIINLARSAYIAPSEIVRRQLMTLVSATVITGLIGPVSLISSGLNLFPMPMVVMSAVLMVFVSMVGYGVARYSALVEKRTIDRDFFYNLIGISIVVALYTLASWALVFYYRAPNVIVILIPLLGVLTHTILNAASRFLDQFFYHGDTRHLRTNLHNLRKLAGESESMKVLLEQILGVLCGPIKASYGLILSHQNGTARQIAEFHWKWSRVELPIHLLNADDLLHLEPNFLPAPLENAALLVPLYFESEQVGTLLLGHPVNGVRFANVDVDRLLYPADQIAEALYINRQNTEHLEQIAEIANKPLPAPVDQSNIPVQVTENVLRNLSDYLYLADSPVAEMKIVKAYLAGGRKTHVERGKAVHSIVLKALEQMKPDEENPPNPLSREWYPYTILHEAYVKGIQNRDIMGKLYISEGTFNRTRRAAILSLARILVEMDLSG